MNAAPPTGSTAMAWQYVLDADDFVVVRARRRPTNRLGFAIQLRVLRYPCCGASASLVSL